jgi:hypothetical protein
MSEPTAVLPGPGGPFFRSSLVARMQCVGAKDWVSFLRATSEGEDETPCWVRFLLPKSVHFCTNSSRK